MNGMMNGMLFPFGTQSDAALDSLRGAMERNAAAYWRSQANLLASMQDLTNEWFARRQEGAQAAQEAAQRLCCARNPAEAASEMQIWMRGATERLMADAMAVQRQATSAAGALGQTAAGGETSQERAQEQAQERAQAREA